MIIPCPRLLQFHSQKFCSLFSLFLLWAKRKVGVFFIFDTKLLLHCFREEADEFVEIGSLNGLFVLGRSIGFIGKSVSVCLLLSNF